MPDVTRNNPKPRVGFIGTGIMGGPMAMHVLSAGFSLIVWNRSVEKTRVLAESGATVAVNCADGLQEADIAVCMLSSGSVVDEVLFMADENGVVPVERMKPGSTLIMMSSIPVGTCQRHAEFLSRRGVNYVDAPVSGGEGGAKAGTLTIMAGGDAPVIQSIGTVLKTMGSVTRVGRVGMGQLAKLANQIIVGITIGAVAEALLLTKQAGADLRIVRKALEGGFADSTVLRVHGERMERDDFAPGAPAVYQLKDLRTAQSLATELALTLPLLSTITALYEDMCQGNLSQLDHSALYQYLAHARTRQIE